MPVFDTMDDMHFDLELPSDEAFREIDRELVADHFAETWED